jgi:hypothetical protein
VTAPIAIVNNAFTFSVPTAQCGTVQTAGTFTSPTNASGTLLLSFPGGPTCTCTGSATYDWSMDFTTPSAPQVLTHPASQSIVPGQHAQFTSAFNGSPMPSFQWEISTNGGGNWSNVPATSPFSGGTSPTLTILSTGAAALDGAQFRVRAQNASGSATSNPATLGSGTPGGPIAPSSFRIIAMAGNAVTFAWTLPASGPPLTGLQLEGGLTPGTVLGALPLGVMSATTLQLPSGSFYLRLRSIAGGAVSGPSNEVLAHINVAVPPSPPANLLGLANGSGLQLVWTPTFGGGPATGAVLEVTGTLSGSLPLGPIDEFNFPTMPPGTYTFSVRQTNAGGTSAPSNPVILTFPRTCANPPDPPATFVAFRVGPELHLHWQPPANGPAPTQFILNVTGALVGSFPMAGRSLVVAAPPGTFTFTMVAANPCGVSAATPSQTVSF